jgi:hypothetical protein
MSSHPGHVSRVDYLAVDHGWDVTPLSVCRWGSHESPSSPDPLPGDFGEELEALDLDDVQVVAASYDRHLVIQFTLGRDDAAALQKTARSQGEKPGVIVRSLIRAA